MLPRFSLGFALAFGSLAYTLSATAQPRNAGPLALAAVRVADTEAVDFDRTTDWTKAPAFLRGAKIYSNGFKSREIELEATSDGLVLIAASWTYDGNNSGGWTEGRSTKDMLIQRGWGLLGDMTLKEKDVHQIFAREFKAGEKARFHTRKYNPPFLLVPSPNELPTIGELLKRKPAALVVERPPAKQPGPTEAVADLPAAMKGLVERAKVLSAEPVSLDDLKEWTKVPGFLRGAVIYSKTPKGRELEFEALKDGLVVLAASWTYDGNDSGGWLEGRFTSDAMIQHGWAPIGYMTLNEKDVHQLFARQAKSGERFKFHTRKYNQPLLLIPQPTQEEAVTELVKAKTPVVAKVLPAVEKPNPLPASSPASPPASAPMPPLPAAMELSVAGVELPQHLPAGEWKELPAYLKDAQAWIPKNNVLELKVNQTVQILVAASWTYDGNQSGGWIEHRSTLPQLVKDGWEPVAEVSHEKHGLYTLLRKTVKAGNTVRFSTRKYHPPIALLPANAHRGSVSKLAVRPTVTNDLSTIAPVVAAPQAATAVLLRAHEPDPLDRFAIRGLLLRELVRQAVLLAAREELGLVTRDESLGESWETSATGMAPLDVVVRVQLDGRIAVTLFRFTNGQPEVLWDDEYPLGGDDRLVTLATSAEAWSRKELVAALRKAGFNGKPNGIVEDGPAGSKVEQQLEEMHVLPQFAAVRRLHRLLHDEGESPERLVALARAYANLGVLTEHLWHPAYKAYQGRALLYSERAVARWPQLSQVWSGRAYARALVGLHAAALADLAQADTLQTDSYPTWHPLIAGFCRFDPRKVEERANEGNQLALVLRLLTRERYSGATPVVDAAQAVLAALPDNDRVLESLYETQRIDIRGQAAALGIARTAEYLPQRLHRLDLPPKAKEVVLQELDARRPTFDEAGERKRRLQLIRALREEGAVAKDRTEPSWQALATWIEEVAFWQTARQLEHLRRVESEGIDNARKQLVPLVQDHAYRAFLDAFTNNPKTHHDKLLELVAAYRPHNALLSQAFLLDSLGQRGIPQGEHFGTRAMQHQDQVYRDILREGRYSREIFWKEHANNLRRVSPHSHLTVASSIEFDWAYSEPHAEEWERQHLESSRVQAALGKQYLAHQKLEDAIRCLERAIRLEPDFQSYAALASAWLQLKNEARWLETWNNFLHEEEQGLNQTLARVKVADYFLLQGRPVEALPYAEDARGSGALWAIRTLADCKTALKQFSEAEQLLSSSVDHYTGAAPLWYFWCRRTNKGNLAGAKSKILEVQGNGQLDRFNSNYLTYLVMEGEAQKALELYREILAAKGAPQYGFSAALLADELNQPDIRDAMLKIVVATGERPEYGRKFLVELAKLVQAALADPNKTVVLGKRCEELLNKIDDPRERSIVAYFSGKFLHLHSQTEGIALLKKATRLPFNEPLAALAAVELRAIESRK
jgi:hypothetical protein